MAPLSGKPPALDGWTREGDRWIRHVLLGDRKRGGWSNQLAYKLSVPADYDPRSRRKYATVVHLHGYGGPKFPTNDPEGLGGVFGQLWKKQEDPIIGIFPQWDGSAWGSPDSSRKLIEILNHEKTQLRIDPDRVYLTGQSMGGYGSYFIAQHYPGVFAAVAPISGSWAPFGPEKRTSVPRDLSKWRHLPYWAAHGMKDTKVAPFANHQATVDALREGGVHVRFTAYPGGGHHVKQIHYANQEFFDWLLAQKRGTPHNYELSVDAGGGAGILGFFEPGTTRRMTARAPDREKREVFTGWTCVAGSSIKDTTTNALGSRGRFSNARALTTTFTMPAGDVIVRANYEAR